MPNGSSKPGAFISYPRADAQIARKLRDCLITLANIEPLLDQEFIKPGDDFELDITDKIRRSQWFIIICNGDLDSEKRLDWCYYEAGQFRSLMKNTLMNKHLDAVDAKQKRAIEESIAKKIYVLNNKSIPRQLERWNATKVCLVDKDSGIPSFRVRPNFEAFWPS